ncbi:acyltransferase family protein [Duganella sp. FT135W]|uniref:Acyltransferase family protein n=1 Tax=Duganella flavida TaxID=2692175 RepID=A0A6L8K3M8_9BURK|nr:acyltransferase [Duganella flavida]MYM22103.1 acyltransferase family protein [Duganella flavida]
MTKDRVNEIDLLRFIAAISVVLFHYAFRGFAADGLSNMPYPLLAPYARYGYLGVELFFMISGFVILMTASGGSLRSFVISRVVRLYPAFWACCTLTFAMISLFEVPPFQAGWQQYLVNLTMMSGFVDVPSIDNAYWSLFIELKFYALVAIVLLLGRVHQVQLWLWAWLGISIANQFVHSGKVTMFLLTNYSAFFIAGACCYLIWSRGASLTRLAMLLLAWGLGTWQALVPLMEFEQHYATRMSRFGVVVIIAGFFVVLLLISLRRTGWIGQRRWLLAGVLTYPLYLLHQNIGFILFHLGYPEWNRHLLLWSVVAGMCVLAYLVHRIVEQPLAGLMKRGLAVGMAALDSRMPLRR